MSPDRLTPEQRRFNMSRIRGRDTRPEMIVRRGLHALGFRYRLHDRSLPGRPDLVLPRHSAVIQIHGCFWHGHDCPKGVIPTTNTPFWAAKIARNQARDAESQAALGGLGWRVLTVWECAIRGRARLTSEELRQRCAAWLREDDAFGEIVGRWPDEPAAVSAAAD